MGEKLKEKWILFLFSFHFPFSLFSLINHTNNLPPSFFTSTNNNVSNFTPNFCVYHISSTILPITTHQILPSLAIINYHINNLPLSLWKVKFFPWKIRFFFFVNFPISFTLQPNGHVPKKIKGKLKTENLRGKSFRFSNKRRRAEQQEERQRGISCW